MDFSSFIFHCICNKKEKKYEVMSNKMEKPLEIPRDLPNPLVYLPKDFREKFERERKMLQAKEKRRPCGKDGKVCGGSRTLPNGDVEGWFGRPP